MLFILLILNLGKSTQLPAYILENNPRGAKIVVSQPRRIAAIGVANRVATERGESKAGVGSVGYMVKGDSASCDRTRLLFCTTGIILRQLQNEHSLHAITHVVIDEVHERSLDSDVLIGLMKKYLLTHPHLHLILMSATLDTERFRKYFGGNVPHVHIPGRTFPVADYTLEDILSFTDYIPKKKGTKATSISHSEKQKNLSNSNSDDALEPITNGIDASHDESHEKIQSLIMKIDETTIDYELISCLVKYLVTNASAADDGSILIFLPGVAEISNARDVIKRNCQNLNILLLPLETSKLPNKARYS
jgi:ATP-dependent RNA helicase DHX57